MSKWDGVDLSHLSHHYPDTQLIILSCSTPEMEKSVGDAIRRYENDKSEQVD